MQQQILLRLKSDTTTNAGKKHISHASLTDDRKLHMRNVQYFEIKNLFFRHIDTVIFKEHELRTVQSLLLYYKKHSEQLWVSSCKH